MQKQKGARLEDFKVSNLYLWYERKIYNFAIEYENKEYHGFISLSISGEDDFSDKILTWETEGHPELDYYDEKKLIDLILKNIT